MAKKDKKKSKKQAKSADPVSAVRTAVERTFQATAGSAQSTRTRAQDLVDDVAGAAGRVRGMIEDVRVLEDLKGLRTEVEALSRRVAALEAAPRRKPAAAAKPATTRRASPARTTGAKRGTSSRSSGSASTRKPPASKPSGSSRSTSAKTRASSPRKPAA